MENSKGVWAPKVSRWVKRKLAGIPKDFCSCCYSLILTTDLFECEEYCRVCQKCMERSVTAAIRRLPNMEVKCPGITCQKRHDSKSLKGVLTPKLYSKICQLEEVKLAGIEDLECCLNCDFIAEVPKCVNIFKCLNRKCRERNCRWCKGPPHIPNGCNASQENEKARAYVEMKMNEGFMRTCFRCESKYYVEDGCKVVECICGERICNFCEKSMINTITSTSSNVCTDDCYRYADTEIVNMKDAFVSAKRAMEEVDDKLTIDAIDKIMALLHSTIAPPPKPYHKFDTELQKEIDSRGSDLFYLNGYLDFEIGKGSFVNNSRDYYSKLTPNMCITEYHDSIDYFDFEFDENDSFENKSPKEQIQYYRHLTLWTIAICCWAAYKFNLI